MCEKRRETQEKVKRKNSVQGMVMGMYCVGVCACLCVCVYGFVDLDCQEAILLFLS